MPMSLTQMAEKLDLSRERVRQLVAEGRIRPAPKLVPFGRPSSRSKQSHVYIFADNARKVGEDGKSGRPRKPLDKAK